MNIIKYSFFLVLAILLFMVSCKPNVQIKDYRGSKEIKNPNHYFSLINVNSPCAIKNNGANDGFDLSQKNIASEHEAIISEYKDKLGENLSINMIKSMVNSESSYYDFEYLVQSNKICDQRLRLHFDDMGMMTAIGEINNKIKTLPSYTWGNLDLSTISQSKIIQALEAEKIKLVSANNCLKLEADKLLPITTMELFVDGLKYEVEVHNDNVLSLKKGHFSIADQNNYSEDGIATIFDDNRGEETTNVILSGLQSDTTFLCGEKIITSKTNSEEMASSPNREYSFPIESLAFRDTSAYANSTLTLEWFSSLGWNNWTEDQINIVLDQSRGPSYVQASDTTLPTVYLPSSSGNLVNLQVDKDVITHELAHHYLYEFWTETSGETLILHEAIADFFASAKSGNSCVAERICSSSDGESNNLCINTQCLRDIKNDIKFNDNEYNYLPPHQKSQVVSGMLWEAHETGGVGLRKLARLVHRSLPLTPNDASITDFVNATLKTVKRKKRLQCILFDAMKAKDLHYLIEDKNIVKRCSFSGRLWLKCLDNISSTDSNICTVKLNINGNRQRSLSQSIEQQMSQGYTYFSRSEQVENIYTMYTSERSFTTVYNHLYYVSPTEFFLSTGLNDRNQISEETRNKRFFSLIDEFLEEFHE